MKWMNILRKAVKAFSLDLLYYEMFKYLPMSLFGVNFVASCNFEKNCARKFSKFWQNPSKIPVKVVIFSKVKKNLFLSFFRTVVKTNTFTGIFQVLC